MLGGPALFSYTLIEYPVFVLARSSLLWNCRLLALKSLPFAVLAAFSLSSASYLLDSYMKTSLRSGI